MVRKLIFLLFPLILISCHSREKKDPIDLDSETITTYYLIRHAEKVRTDASNKDPELTEKGMERAKKWELFFQKVDLDHIYSTDYKRTQQTVKDIAERKKLIVKSYDPAILFSEEIKKEVNGKTVLIVGHSNTTPKFVNMILGTEKYEDMNDDDNSSLFMITVIGNSKKVQVLTVD